MTIVLSKDSSSLSHQSSACVSKSMRTFLLFPTLQFFGWKRLKEFRTHLEFSA